MDRHIWTLHSAVFDIAQARGLRNFEVRYADTGDEVQIDLTMQPANDDGVSAEEFAKQSSSDASC